MPLSSEISRRTFIRDFGRGILGISIGGTAFLSACGDSESDLSKVGTATVERANLGIVSAYLIVRGSEVAVVDTGTVRDARSGLTGADEIGQALDELGLGWSNVGTVIVTHHHGDHAGSLHEVMGLAGDATVGTGGGDIELINERLELHLGVKPPPLTVFEDGQTVFGTTIISTPGHTTGHIAVWDEETSVLIAGDALNGDANGGGVETVDGVGGPNSRRSEDMAAAIESARKLAALQPETIFFGHGAPKLGGAAAAVNALLDQL